MRSRWCAPPQRAATHGKRPVSGAVLRRAPLRRCAPDPLRRVVRAYVLRALRARAWCAAADHLRLCTCVHAHVRILATALCSPRAAAWCPCAAMH